MLLLLSLFLTITFEHIAALEHIRYLVGAFEKFAMFASTWQFAMLIRISEHIAMLPDTLGSIVR